jgi:hypothetical protein
MNVPALVEGIVPFIGGLAATAVAISRRKSMGEDGVPKRASAKYLSWVGVILVIIGLAQVHRALNSNPLSAESFAYRMTQGKSLPIQVDEVTRVDSVEGRANRVTIVSTLTIGNASEFYLRNLTDRMRLQLKRQICENEQYREGVKAGLTIEHLYFYGGKILASISVSEQHCSK